MKQLMKQNNQKKISLLEKNTAYFNIFPQSFGKGMRHLSAISISKEF